MTRFVWTRKGKLVPWKPKQIRVAFDGDWWVVAGHVQFPPATIGGVYVTNAFGRYL